MRDNVKSNSLAILLYGLMLSIMILIVGILISNSKLENPIDLRNRNKISDIAFYDINGEQLNDLKDLGEHDSNGIIYTIVPDDLPDAYSLCFRAKHLYFDVVVGDEILYSTISNSSVLYTNSNGANWIVVPLKHEHKGKVLEIRYQTAYKDRGDISNICYSYADGFILDVILSKIPAVITCLVYVVIGLLLIMLNILVSKFIKADSTMFWLGFMSLSIAFYCMLETQIIQIFVADDRLIHLLVMFAMTLMPIPTIMYSVSLFKLNSKHTVNFIVGLSFGNFVIQTGLNIVGICDYHDNILILQMLLLGSIIMMIVWMILYIIRCFGNDMKLTIYVKFMIAGLCFITLSGVIDIIRYWVDHGNEDPAKFVRFGFLGYLICFAIASSEKIITAFHNTLKLKVVSKLAYEDGLTGLYNRTSYNEMIDNIKENHIPTAVVMMDLNNLKFVNDTFGHDDGDEMLVYAASMIKQAFNIPDTTLYRIGGDEFVAFVQGDDYINQCENAMQELEKLYREFNTTTDSRYKIIIASGYDVYDGYEATDKDMLEEIINNADVSMYENKKKLKQNTYLNIMV